MILEVSALRLQLSQLEGENDEIRRERDKLGAELSKFRKANATLEGHVQDLEIEISDIRRKLARSEAFSSPSQVHEAAEEPTTKSTAPSRKEAAQILPTSSSFLSPHASFEQADLPSSMHRSPSSVTGNKRRIEKSQRHDAQVGQGKSKHQEETCEGLETMQTQILVQDEVLRLTGESIAKYLRGSVRLNVRPTPIQYHFSRELIQEIHGGSAVELLTRSADKGRNFLFPMPEVSPHMPTAPGNPALLLSCRHTITIYTCTMFSRARLDPSKWQYMGEYRSQVVGHISASTFKGQTQATKELWARKFLMNAKMPVHIGIRPDDEHAIKYINKETSTEKDIIKVFERGDARIDIIQMTCVSYDHHFIDGMLARSTFLPRKSSTPGSEKPSKRKRR